MSRVRACRAAVFFLMVQFLNGLAVQGFTAPIRPSKASFYSVSEGKGTGVRQKASRFTSTLNMAVAPSTAKPSRRKMGNLTSNLFKLLWITPKKAKAIKTAVSQAVHINEVALIAFCGWALVPVVRYLYNMRYPERVDFPDTYFYRISQLVGQIAQIGGVVYAIDILTVVLGVQGFKSIPKTFNICFAKTLYLLFGAYRLAKFKEHLLIKKRGKTGIVNKIANVVIAIVTAFGVMDILTVQTGMAVNSVFALGGAGTLIVSLGSQNMATQIVNGLTIASTGKFYEGEKITIGTGDKAVRGTVQKMGLLATDIRASDETVMNVPNQQLAGKRVGNITRGKRSSVKLTVWFSYDDIDKITQVCSDIKTCIQERCPRLDPENRPFRVNLRDFKRSHLEVGIDTFFRIPPYSNDYYENRQQVLYAIADAAKKNGVKFDIPIVTLQSSGDRDVVGKMFHKLQSTDNVNLSGS